MAHWRDYAGLYPGPEHTITGTVKVGQGVYSPQLNNQRDLFVYLPPGYDHSETRYPVIYMHDGQNLFDAALSFSGEWQVDEALHRLSAEGIAAIVVGIPNIDGLVTGGRLDEYAPFSDPLLERGGKGDAYLAFIRETVKPLIDTDFRALPDRAHTGIMGSSMGGLISLYAFLKHPDVFGFAGIMSPAFWFGRGAIYPLVEQAAFTPGKLYMDIGTDELRDIPPEHQRPGISSEVYLNDARRMNDLLIQKGYRPGADLRYVEDVGAIHHESAWARRLPDALRFLLG
jgi:predicted alpha/beta superfamily hydrolase